MKANKVVKVYAEVFHSGWDFRVYEDGKVFYWSDFSNSLQPYDDYEDYYEEVKAAGLEVLK